MLAPWLTTVVDRNGEHVVLSDGWHHIRLDLARGSLARGAVQLQYQVRGIVSAEPKILPLRRLIDFSRHRRFLTSLYPPDRRVDRWLFALRVHDAIQSGASQRDIVQAFYGDVLVGGHGERADSLRSRVRRLAREAAALARGGYRQLMLRQPSP